MGDKPSSSQGASGSGMDEREHLEKSEIQLKITKLALEQQLLARQLSVQTLALEWTKALTFPVALIGLIASFWIGWNQILQSQQTRDNDRFDKALSRIASKELSERLTGVSGLRLFLNETDVPRQAAALHFLVNAIANEKESTIRSAILNAFSDVTTPPVTYSALNSALSTAIEMNRTLYSAAKQLSKQRRMQKEREIRGNAIGRALSANEKRELAKINQRPLGEVSSEEIETLEAIAKTVSLLVRKGAYTRDMTQIYCVACDFTLTRHLDGVRFDGSQLDFSDFTYSSLKGSSFDSATLHHTIFFGANLQDASLRAHPTHFDYSTFSPDLDTIGPSTYHYFLPVFQCANLIGADLRGRALITGAVNFSDIFVEFEVNVQLASMQGAKIDQSTRASPFAVLWSVELPNDYSGQFEIPITTYYPFDSGSYPFREYALYASLSNLERRIESWGVGRTAVLGVNDKSVPENGSAVLPLFLEIISAGRLSAAKLPNPIVKALADHQASPPATRVGIFRAEGVVCDGETRPSQGFSDVAGRLILPPK